MNGLQYLRQAISELEQRSIAELEKKEPMACGTYQEVTDTMNALWAGTLEQVQIAEEMKNKKLYTAPPQRIEQNFCPRCGKRTNDIHTCTPPQGIYYTPPQRTWQGLTQSDFNEIYDLFANKVSSDFIFEKMYSTIEAKLKQKNGYAEEKNT